MAATPLCMTGADELLREVEQVLASGTADALASARVAAQELRGMQRALLNWTDVRTTGSAT